MADLPAELSTGTVTGRFIVAIIDGNDSGQEPDVIPAKGTIRFKSSVPYVPVPVTTLGPVTVMKGPVVGVLDNEGYLCTPNPVTGEIMYRGVKLIATDDPDMAVTDWTWTAEYVFESVGSSTMQIPAHSFSLTSGGSVDLTTVVKVPSSPGYGLPQAEAAVLRAEAAAQAGLDVKAMADAGEFDGATGPEGPQGPQGETGPQGPQGLQGAPGNATVRFSTTAGKAIYLKEPGTSTEHLIHGDTGWRDISSLITNGYTGTIRIRRTKYDVKLQIVSMSAASATSGTFFTAPTGFGLGNSSIGNVRGFVFDNDTPITMRGVNISGASGAVSITQYSASDTSLLGSFEWSTNEAWPTTLPGTAVGTIPNL